MEISQASDKEREDEQSSIVEPHKSKSVTGAHGERILKWH